MLSMHTPIVGHWYRDFEDNLFEVVAIDDDDNLIELQYYEGDLNTIDHEAWNVLGAEQVAPPNEWGPYYDDVELQDDEDYYHAYTRYNLEPGYHYVEDAE